MRKHVMAVLLTASGAALAEYHLYDEMKSVVAAMRRKQPASEDIMALESWLQRRTGH
jgi:hypothetical protein